MLVEPSRQVGCFSNHSHSVFSSMRRRRRFSRRARLRFAALLGSPFAAQCGLGFAEARPDPHTVFPFSLTGWFALARQGPHAYALMLVNRKGGFMKKTAILLSSLVLTLLSAPVAAQTLGAVLTGSQEVPPADPDGLGTATFTFNNDRTQLTADITFSGIGTVLTGAHIHRGVAGANGGVVIPFFVTPTTITNGRITGTFAVTPTL